METYRFDWNGFKKQNWFGLEIYLENFSKKQLELLYRLKIIDKIQEFIILYNNNTKKELHEIYVHPLYLDIFKNDFNMKFSFNKYINNSNNGIIITPKDNICCIIVGDYEIIIDGYLGW
jgi:hypothetical protein